jgi:hypothetical protein
MDFPQRFLQVMGGNEGEILQILITAFQFYTEFVTDIEVLSEFFCQIADDPTRYYKKPGPNSKIEIKIKFRAVEKIQFLIGQNKNPNHKNSKKGTQYSQPSPKVITPNDDG